MDGFSLIPTPDTLPAPWWIFEALDLITFVVHILLVNLVVGGSLLVLYARVRGRDPGGTDSLAGAVFKKIPVAIALGVNFGVAPLLFVQVLYGHLIYSSSVLMATYWILVVPLLILAYYGAYIYTRRHPLTGGLSVAALLLSVAVLLYIAFVFVNNMTLYLHPEKWTAYFEERQGTLLNVGDPTLWPRFLHFLAAAVAVAGLFSAFVWSRRRKEDAAVVSTHVRSGLRVFAWGSAVQIAVGLWLLVSIPSDLRSLFMGGNGLYTGFFPIGMGLGIAAMASGFAGKLKSTGILLLLTVVCMVLVRSFLRTAYLGRFFQVESLKLVPQYGVMALFFAVFVVGMAVVGYMVKTALAAEKREVVR